MKQEQIKKLVLSAMFCALVFAATWISIPAPLVGNINLGDGMLLVGAWTLGGPWAVIACAAGAMLCDLTSPYVIYAPATLVIKALMTAVAGFLPRALGKFHVKDSLSRIFGAAVAELLMVAGYFAYEALALGYGMGAAVNLPFNAIQGGIAVVVSCLVYRVLKGAGLA